MSTGTLSDWQRIRLEDARAKRAAGGHSPDRLRSARGYADLVDRGLAFWQGGRLAITKAGEAALDEAGEVAS